jgi:hypothetical protein
VWNLFCQHPLQDYEKKYAETNTIMATTALLYHDDIDFTVPVIWIHHNMEWPAIKERIEEAIRHPQRIFSATAYKKKRVNTKKGRKPGL